MQRMCRTKQLALLMGWALAATLSLGCGGHVREQHADTRAVTVPITLHDGIIFLQARVNDKPVTLVLDTGAGGNVITPRAAKRLGLTPGKGETDVEGSGGNTTPVSAVRLGSLSVDTASATDQTAHLIPLPEILQCDGLLGTPFLEQWVVTVDYAHSRLTLTPHSAFSPPTAALTLPMRLIGNTSHIEALLEGAAGWFQVDTGANGGITLFSAFVEENHLRGKYMPSFQTVTGRGVGGLVYGDLMRLPEVTLGSIHLHKIPASLSRQTTGVHADPGHAGNIGAEIWRRFTVTFDYADNKLFLTPNALYDSPFPGNRSGLILDFSKRAGVVLAALPNSPASEAGIRQGETLMTLDGKPVAQINLLDARSLFYQATGSKVRLRLRSPTGEEREVTLTLRDIY